MNKLFFTLVAFLFFSFSHIVLAQENTFESRFQIDSLIWSNAKRIPPYPYEAKLDSVLHERATTIKRVYENDSTACCINPFEPSPTLYILDDKGNKLTGREAGDYMTDKLPKNYWAVLEFLVEWNGEISEVRLKKYKGDVSVVNLTEIALKVTAEPDSSFGFPAPKQTRKYWMLHGE